MRILLISDNHGYVDAALLKHASMVDEVWHAGDWLNTELLFALEKQNTAVRGVWGNADGQDLRRIFKEDNFFQIQGLKIWMTHIGGHSGKFIPRVRTLLSQIKPDIFICGHSHILRVDRDKSLNNMLCLNPGACGLQGFHVVRTALRFEIENGKIQNLEAIEFGKRG